MSTERPARPVVSVVVPAYNSRQTLHDCLSCICEQQVSVPFEVILVDDGSTDSTGEMVARQFPQVIYLRCSENRGPGAARNTGWRAARGEVVAFADADVTLDPHWLANGLRYFEDPAVGGVEGRTLISHPERITPFTHWTQNLHGGLFPTCNMFYRKSVLEEVGGFDERFYDPRTKVHFREDVDLAFSVLDRGWKIPFAPDVLAYHAPLHPCYSRPLKLAQRYFYDALLEKKHPKRFREHVEKHQWGRLRICRPRHYFSFANVLSAVALLAGVWSGEMRLAVVSTIVFLPTFAFVALAPIRHSRLTRISVHDYATAFPILLAVPWVYVHSYLRGKWCFRK